jgi:hypothetical protein
MVRARPSESKWVDPVTWFTAVVAFFAVIQTISFVQSERAFVAPTNTDFAVEIVPGIKFLPMLFEIKNSGKSTATIDEVSIAITHDLPNPRAYPTARQFAFPPIVPGGSSKRVLRFETGWGEKIIAEVKSGTRKFYLFGFIKYHDEMNRVIPLLSKRETGFCFVYVPTGGVRDAIFETCKQLPYTYSK